MEEIKIFILRNWKEICAVILFIVSAIIGFITRRKKGYSFSDILLGLISEQLPQWISLAEATGNSGEQKKVQVLNDALNYASKTLGRKLSEEETSIIIANASEQIEKILGTPQKKVAEELDNKAKKKSRYR